MDNNLNNSTNNEQKVDINEVKGENNLAENTSSKNIVGENCQKEESTIATTKEVKHVVEMPHNDRTIEITRDSNFGSKSKLADISMKICWKIAVAILWCYCKMFLGLKVEGREKLKEYKKSGKGYIIVSNHFHVMDTPLIAVAIRPSVVQFTSIESNFAIPVAGRILSFFHVIPMPQNPTKLRYVFDYIQRALQEGNNIHFFPEGVLLPYSNHVRSFNKGAFMCAEKAKVDILPIVFTQRKAKGLFKCFKKHGCSYTAHILDVEKIDESLKRRDAINDIESRVKKVMVDTLDKYDEHVVDIDYSMYM